MVKTEGLTKAAILTALYNNSRPMGMGFLNFDPAPMTEAQAAEIIGDDKHPYFDYVKGRVIKVSLREENGFEERLYDRDNGHGTAQRAIDSIGK